MQASSFFFADLQKFMLISEATTNLLFPLHWQHVYVPILPSSLMHFLDAPVPFIMGVYCQTDEDKESLDIPWEVSLSKYSISQKIVPRLFSCYEGAVTSSLLFVINS